MEEPTSYYGSHGLRAGSRFGHYRLRRLLGEGGFGQVWEAEDSAMDRVVALKLLKPAYSGNESFRQRLYREARAAGRLRDPHVVPVHNCGEIDGLLYIDMRLMDGSDLHTVLAREGPLAPTRAVAVVRQIAAALDAAHAAGLIHRDVKPANILLADDDFACLLDFGLANAATDAKLTSSGTTIGTFAYMPPERLSKAEVSHSADIYAMTCVLYECLTGSPPYVTNDLPALITAHLTAAIPRPSERRPQVPTGFDDVVARGMAKDPDARYDSAGALARAAHRALSPPGQDQADTMLASTQAAILPDRGQAPAVAQPPRVSPPKDRRSSPKPAASPAKAVQGSTKLAGSPIKPKPPAAKPPANPPSKDQGSSTKPANFGRAADRSAPSPAKTYRPTGKPAGKSPTGPLRASPELHRADRGNLVFIALIVTAAVIAITLISLLL